MATDSPARASTEDWCETGPRHVWSYRSHAGTPRVETRTCMACGFLSVEPVRELLRAAPAGTGSPTPAEAGDGGSDPNWPARRLIQARARVDELVRERDAARAELSQVREQLDEAQAELDDWRATPPAELQSKVEAKLRAEIGEAIAAAGPRGDKPLPVIVAEIVAELSQVQKERDALKLAAGLTADTVVSFAVGAIRNMLDTAHVARTQLRPQIARLEADLVDARREAEASEAARGAVGLLMEHFGYSRSDGPLSIAANAVAAHNQAASERNEARSALAAVRAEVGALGADFDRQSTVAITAPAKHIWTRAADAVRALVTDQSPAAPASVVYRCHCGNHLAPVAGVAECATCKVKVFDFAGLSPTSDTQTDTGGE